MLRLRFLSAFIGVPVLLALAIFGGWPYVVVIAGAAVIGMFEISNMLKVAGFRPLLPVGVGLAVLIAVNTLVPDPRVTPALLIVGAVGALWWMMRRENTTGALVDWALSVAPALYVGGTLHYFIPLRNTPDDNGLFWVLAVLVCTWTNDVTAFFVGRRWGKVRLAPRVSPGKSVEGAAGGILGAAIVAVILGPLLTAIYSALGLSVANVPSGLRLAGLGLVIGVCGVVGDLMESFIKRQCGAKDSGDLIPGHGGILDRIDSIMLAVVGAYFYVVTTA